MEDTKDKKVNSKENNQDKVKENNANTVDPRAGMAHFRPVQPRPRTNQASSGTTQSGTRSGQERQRTGLEAPRVKQERQRTGQPGARTTQASSRTTQASSRTTQSRTSQVRQQNESRQRRSSNVGEKTNVLNISALNLGDIELKNLLFSPLMFFLLYLPIMEIFFHASRFDGVGFVFYKILYGLAYGALFGVLISFLPKIGQKIATVSLTVVLMLYYMTQLLYNWYFETYLSLASMTGVAGQVFDYVPVIIEGMIKEWFMMILFLIPTILLIVAVLKFMKFEKISWKISLVGLGGVACFFVFVQLSLFIAGTALYSPYDVKKNYDSVDMAIEKLGVMESFVVDTRYGVLERLGLAKSKADFDLDDGNPDDLVNGKPGKNGDTTEETTEETVFVDRSPNVLDVNLEALMESENNDNVKEMHKYFNSVTPTNKNEYTGMFEGYNLVFVTAEGFSGYVVDPELTPTLYKMVNEGFVFNNYYTPLWYGSTLGGEYANLTGTMPKDGGYLSFQRTGEKGNDMMFTLSEQLLKKDYKVVAYHNNSYKYYDRHITHPNIGFDFMGVGNGMPTEKAGNGGDLWPQSDLFMVQQTVDKYINEEPFYAYYMTVSGHAVYTNVGNAMSYRHKDYVENLEYSDTTKCYIAAQYELELAMQELLKRLEEAGVADHTLIVLTADHVPYNDKPVCDELAGEELDKTFSWYKSKLIIYSTSMEEPIVVDKPCYSLDVLPTVSNLMGLPYDSRMLVGQDILSDSEGMVIFADRSWMNEHCKYNAGKDKLTSFVDGEISQTYVDKINKSVRNKFNVSQSIVDYDYYKYIDKAVYGN